MTKKSRVMSVLIPATIAGLLLAGCTTDTGNGGSPAATPPSEPTGTLRVNFGGAPPSWAPGAAVEPGYMRVPYETLVTLSRDYEVQPNLAVSWELAPKTVTLELRDDVTFHDGTPFNAEAVKANLEYVRDHPGQFAGPLQAVASVDVVDEFTVQVNLKFPAPTFMTMLTQRNVFIASPAALADESILANPVGTGPWAYSADDSVEGTKWAFHLTDDYWGDLPYYESVELYAIADDAAATAAVLNGEIDITDTEEDQLPRFEGQSADTISFPAVRNNIVFFDRGPGGVFEDADVRKALCLAIDDDAYQALPNASTLAVPDQHFLEGEPGHNADIEGYSVDLDEAQSLLDGATVEAAFPAAPFLKQQLEFFADSMNELEGVNVTVQDLAVPDFLSTWNSGKYPFGVGQNQQMTPYDWYSTWFAATARANPAKSESPELKAAADEAIAAGDSEEADALWGEVMRIIIDEEALACGFGVGAEILAWNTTTVAGVEAPSEFYEVNLVNYRTVFPVTSGE